MGGATVEGMIKADYFDNDSIIVSDPSEAVTKKFSEQGIRTTTDNALAAKEADVVMVFVKPWLVETVLKGIFLCIPNIAIAQLASMTFLVPCGATESHQTEQVKAIFDTMGNTLITDEAHLAAGTTLASCGIAYAMRYIRAASEGGVELGFKADQAKEIVMQTMLGAVKLLEASGLHPEAAIDLVTTPGGVTIKGLNEMEHAGFTSAVIRGLKAGAK